MNCLKFKQFKQLAQGKDMKTVGRIRRILTMVYVTQNY
jgi:hypothetical protein